MSKKDRFNLKGNTIAGTFRVDEVVAEGGFGVVYRAFHLHFRSPVALKCLKIPGALSDEERSLFLEQFRSEAEIQFRLSAALPHIVRPLHVDAVRTEQGEFVPLMALEWLEGRSFERIIEHRTFSDQPPMPLIEAVDLIGPAAQALHQAHNFIADGESLVVVHRDIKPDNLFVTQIGGKDVVKILDFGISKVRRAATQLAGHFSQTSGTAPFSPAYGAPEQWVPKRFGQTGPWTDVWGLALTLVEIIKGDAVIVGDHQAMMGTALDPKVRPTPRSEGVNVSDEVEAVFEKALALDPRYRYQSIEAFWESLQRAIEYSGDYVQEYQETPSGNRIPLPPMSAPTPWASPAKSLNEPKKPFPSLPPMMAPAVLQRTSREDQELEASPEASYPINPHSDLQPVPAAPTNWDHFDPEVPPSSIDHHPDDFVDPPPLIVGLDEVEGANGDIDLDGGLAGPLPSLPPEDAVTLSQRLSPPHSRKDPSIQLELEPTSTYPKGNIVSQPPPNLPPVQPPIPDLTLDEAPPVRTKKKSAASRKPPPPVRTAKSPPPAPSSRAPSPSRGLVPAATTGRPPPPKRSLPPERNSVRVAGPPPPPSRKQPPPPPRRESDTAEKTGKPLSLVPSRRNRSTGS